MNVYIYSNYISSDLDKLEEKIQEDIAKHVKSISRVESLAETTYEDIETVQVNPQAIFRYMNEAYIFIEHIGIPND